MSVLLYEKDIVIKGSNKTEFQLDGAIKILLSLRQIWKEMDNYIIADQIRKSLNEIGILVVDKKGGTSAYKNDRDSLSDLFTPIGRIR